MKILYYCYLLPALLILASIIACKKDSLAKVGINGDSQTILAKISSGFDPTDSVAVVLYGNDPKQATNIVLSDELRGGDFIYKPASAKLVVDNGIVFASKDGGYWERKAADTVKLAWYKLKAANADNSAPIRNGIQAAITRKAAVVAFPAGGTYRVQAGNYWTVPDRFNLHIDGKGAVIEVDIKAAAVAQETYVMAFKCTETANSLNSKIVIKNLNIKAPAIKPQWTSANFAEHKLVMAIETDGIYSVDINNCKLNDICGYGIRLKNFVSASIDKVTETNVGGHFPVENGYDNFGDGIWLGHYDVETVRTSRKSTYAKITNCIINGYDTGTNGNFASRSGITVEGFTSHAPDIIVKLDVSNTTVGDYDRNLHVEGISANIHYTNCRIRDFFGVALVINSVKTALMYNNCTASGQLAANPKQERYGLGGAVQFNSYFDLTLTNNTVFTFNRPATFRANLYLQDNSVLDFGNADVFFDHANLYVNNGGSMINIPASVARGYNMYGGSVNLNGATITGYNKGKGVLHGENIDAAVINNCRLNNSRLLFVGGFGTLAQDE